MVIRSWERSYSPALSVKKGEQVETGVRDEAWPGWIWCRNDSGLGGWLPEELLSSNEGGGKAEGGGIAKTLEAFDTGELTVLAGQTVEGNKHRNGWDWCRNDSGQEGWVPSDCLKLA
ncbi:SH3 domain-containing protein [Pelagibius sp. Alg239-R121]|uniref:SH3 domain-containing protein n=1 Tax=Pelagibius sp. Alg239-R121 TaxID=2993448 RepID=UPI0024A60FBC|nr:SH3 domain-containing protein [Pelagibius sp. Alg239-R121]